jgi:hypothetical protein
LSTPAGYAFPNKCGDLWTFLPYNTTRGALGRLIFCPFAVMETDFEKSSLTVLELIHTFPFLLAVFDIGQTDDLFTSSFIWAPKGPVLDD